MSTRAIVVLSLAALAACSGDQSSARDTTPASAARATAAGGKPECPSTGHWSECQIRYRLERSGLAPRATTEKVGDLPKMDAKPISLMVGNAGLALYLFPDSSARHRAAASLDTVKFIPQSRPVGIRGETTVIQNDNLLALLFSRNEHQRERVSDAITAGAPQP